VCVLLCVCCCVCVAVSHVYPNRCTYVFLQGAQGDGGSHGPCHSYQQDSNRVPDRQVCVVCLTPSIQHSVAGVGGRRQQHVRRLADSERAHLRRRHAELLGLPDGAQRRAIRLLHDLGPLFAALAAASLRPPLPQPCSQSISRLFPTLFPLICLRSRVGPGSRSMAQGPPLREPLR
jgi:hypothetical protein